MIEETAELIKLVIADLKNILDELTDENKPKEPEYANKCCGNCGRYRDCSDTMRDRTVTGNWCGKWNPATDAQIEAREKEILKYLAEIKGMKA